uniref:AAC(3) family N-acetyltransferase n=1 Tax=Flavobacterium sp. TaxID=239 RepID=UPI0040495A85
MKIISKELLISQLSELGLKKGDLIFLTMNVGLIGWFNKNRKEVYQDLLNTFTDVVDINFGGIILPAYTNGVSLWKAKTPSFSLKTKTYAGGFSNFVINQEKSFRSNHPYYSNVGIGKRAVKVLKKTSIHSKAYQIFDSFQEERTFYLMIGTAYDKKNAPPSLHYCQEKLGFTKYFPFKHFEKIKLDWNNKIIKRQDAGGCSKGGYKLSIDLVFNGVAKEFFFGQAKSVLIDPIKSTKYTYLKLLKNRKIYTCDNKLCLSCQGNYYYEPLNFIKIIFLKIYANFKNRF